MAVAAIRPMMAVMREEAAIITAEAGQAARTTIAEEATNVVRQAGHESLNPLAIREAAEASAQRVMNAGEGSVLGALGHAPSPMGATRLTSSTSTVGNGLLHEATTEVSTMATKDVVLTETTLVGQVLEESMGATVKEAMTNAGETGFQDLAMQTSEAVSALLDGKFVAHPAMSSMNRPTAS